MTERNELWKKERHRKVIKVLIIQKLKNWTKIEFQLIITNIIYSSRPISSFFLSVFPPQICPSFISDICKKKKKIKMLIYIDIYLNIFGQGFKILSFIYLFLFFSFILFFLTHLFITLFLPSFSSVLSFFPSYFLHSRSFLRLFPSLRFPVTSVITSHPV